MKFFDTLKFQPMPKVVNELQNTFLDLQIQMISDYLEARMDIFQKRTNYELSLLDNEHLTMFVECPT